MDVNIAKYVELSFQKIRKLKENEKGEVWLVSDKSGKLAILKYIFFIGLPYQILKEKNFSLCPRVIHAWEDDNKTVVIEEYAHGETLLDRIARKEYLTEIEAKSLLLKLCDGLLPIHAQGVIHRDITPSNLILQPGNIVKLIDFDAARVVKKHKAEDTHFLGTVGYAPPEQFGYGQTDERSDIYSIGVTFQKALPENYSGYLTKILSKCAEIDPNKRYQNVKELKRAIIFRAGCQKWGKKLVVAAVIIVLAITLNMSQTFETPKEEIIEETIAPIEIPDSAKEEITTLPAEKKQTVEPAKTPPTALEPTVVPNDDVANTVSSQRKSPPKLNSTETSNEINNIETIEAFLEAVKDDPKAYERWKNDKTYRAPANASKEEREIAQKKELEYMKNVELGSRVNAFKDKLPETLTEEEKRRAINEYVIEQKKILDIKN